MADRREGSGFKTDAGEEVNVVTGPRPYLWIGDKDGRHLATIEGDLRAIRDAITKALRSAGGGT